MGAPSDAFATLNPDQLRAVRHDDGPLLVMAGPGSGKTAVIAHRIAYRVNEAGVSPERILAITFTQRAATEMKERLQALLPDAGNLQVGTFHSLCYRLLQRHVRRLARTKSRRLLPPNQSRTLIRAIEREMALSETYRSGSMIAAISAVKNGLAVHEAARRFVLPPSALTAAMTTYASRLDHLDAMDLDDLPQQAVELLRTSEDVGSHYRKQLKEILVDEFQDTNPLQLELLQLLRPCSGAITAVGDEDQAIYGWRQASSGSAEIFSRYFSGGQVIVLHETYRCSKRTLRLAGELIQHNPGRTEKPLRTTRPAGEPATCYRAIDERDEATWIASEITRLGKTSAGAYSEIAILFRVNTQSRALEDALVRGGIPYRVSAGQQRFYLRPEIQAVGAFLRLAVDPGDDPATDLLVRLVPGVGPRRLEGLHRDAGTAGTSLATYLGSREMRLPDDVSERLYALGCQIDGIRAQRTSRLDLLLKATFAAMARIYPGMFDPVLDTLDELQSVVAELDPRTATLRAFVDRITFGQSSDDGAGVILLSLHAAKGLEFPTVFLTGLEEGVLPHWRSLDHPAEVQEERRLCYVGATRSSGRLYLSYAQSRMHGRRAVAAGPSRFLAEMGVSNMHVLVGRR